jgi:hypothetical protein
VKNTNNGVTWGFLWDLATEYLDHVLVGVKNTNNGVGWGFP